MALLDFGLGADDYGRNQEDKEDEKESFRFECFI